VHLWEYRAVDGRRVADIDFVAVELADDGLIGPEGAAGPAVALGLDHLIVGLCAEAVGAMDAALWLTRNYLKTRKQFGTTLNTFQALQHRMADMLVETELARSMLLRALACLADPDPRARRAGVSAAKAQIGEAGYFVGGQAVQLHGGIGVTEEYVVGHYFRRLTLARGLFGATDVHLSRFARWSRESSLLPLREKVARSAG
jgi:alkylation response protein AidB-like acyl-CoA dehydrogenase